MLPSRTRRKPYTPLALRRETVPLPCRIMAPSRNLLIRESTGRDERSPLRRKTQTQEQTKERPFSLSELKRLSISSIGTSEQPGWKDPKDGRRTGFKYNRIKINPGGHHHPNQTNINLTRESLYDKSLRKAHSALRRQDFEKSLNEIVVNQCLTSKRSLLNQQQARRLKTEVCQPQSATIIIQLKRLFKTRGEYSFVQNHYDPGTTDEEKRNEQIFSTAHTYLDRQATNASNTSSLHSRTHTAPHAATYLATAGLKEQPRRGRPKKENELMPWLKDTERALSELDFEPFLPI